MILNDVHHDIVHLEKQLQIECLPMTKQIFRAEIHKMHAYDSMMQKTMCSSAYIIFYLAQINNG